MCAEIVSKNSFPNLTGFGVLDGNVTFCLQFYVGNLSIGVCVCFCCCETSS